MFGSSEHQQVLADTKRVRNAAARSNRAAGGPVYRKVAVTVSLLEATDAAGMPLVLATSDAPNERGRFFALTREDGGWRCACATFRQLRGCAHVGHLAARQTSENEGGFPDGS